MYTKIQKIRWFQSDESSKRRMKWLLISDGRMDLQGIQEESMHSSQKSKEERLVQLVQYPKSPRIGYAKTQVRSCFPKTLVGNGWESFFVKKWLGISSTITVAMTGIYHGTYHRTFHGIYHGIYPLVMTNIAMENGPLIDDLPIDLPIKMWFSSSLC